MRWRIWRKVWKSVERLGRLIEISEVNTTEIEIECRYCEVPLTLL